MVHLPAAHNYREMVRTPGMVRFSIARGCVSEREATLLVKGNSLLLKVLTKTCDFRLIFFKLAPDNVLLYGIEIDTDPAAPTYVWAIAERAEEIEAINNIFNGDYSIIHLYNEVAVNVASGEPKFEIAQSPPTHFLDNIALVENGSEKLSGRIQAFFDTFTTPIHTHPDAVILYQKHIVGWNQIKATYITNSLEKITFRILEANEGDQQEHLAVWLTDALSLSGAHKGPIVHEKKPRELTDVLFAHSHGLFLIESKVASVLNGDDTPAWDKLKKNTRKNIDKAIAQHAGACRNIVNGTRITTKDGHDLDVPRNLPIHCIVLVTDIEMIADEPAYGGEAIKEFGRTTKHLLHILDPDALMGIILNANKLSKESQYTTPIMAFDFILMKRWEESLKLDTAYFRFTVETEIE